MIKINLLAEGKKSVVRKSAAPSFAVSQRDLAAWIVVAVAVLGVLGVAAYWWVLKGEIARKVEQVRVAQKEVDELKPILAEVEEYKKKKARLEHKINVINQLKENQKGPVQIMDYVSRALPELLWLERLDLSGNYLALQGSAFNTNAVAAFIENLGKVREFHEPVLTDAVRDKNQAYKFKINFRFNPLQKPESGASAPAAGGGR